MILHLAERLDVPLRERNTLLTSAGFAPLFPERTLADPPLESASKAIELFFPADPKSSSISLGSSDR